MNPTLPFLHQKEICVEYCMGAGGSICRVSDTALLYQNDSGWYSRIMVNDTAITDHGQISLFQSALAETGSGLLVYETAFRGMDGRVLPNAEYLISLGFEHELTAAGMECELKEELPDENFGDHVIRITADQMEEWCRSLDLGYSAGDPAGVSENDGTDYHVFLKMVHASLYGFCENGVIVGTLLLYKGSAAGIHEVSVLPAYRRKGIAGTLVKTALHDAYTEGYKKAVLLSTAMGFALYKKLGFEPVSTIEHWRLKK